MTLPALLNAVEMGIIFSIMALGVYLTFRILDFPDLTVDGSFVTGASIAAVLIFQGYSPILASIAALFAGFIAGTITGILHTKGKINNLLSGILMMIALYSINLRIMGLADENVTTKPNIPLLNTETIFSRVDSWAESVGFGQWGIILFMIVIVLLFKLFTDYFLKTEIGLALRATGDNKRMIRSFSANTDGLIILGVGLSNAFVAFSGGLMAQYHEFSDISMGIGMIVIGLASVIIGEAIFGTKTIGRTTMAVIIGSIIYRIFISFALVQGILDASDQKLVTAIIVILALTIPKAIEKYRDKKRKVKRQQKMLAELKSSTREGKTIA
ncbi:ABC transporter permease [Fervidibacillus halotolerans]|uniref:ABC transporter permease n=1 Tax=Fervidibacillus halotolerans TaxID=2980027 RepID=A0A9E8LY39_9BACI|nr:ABC transporter permease [Fervidibacillus halotolerans]WAA11845.1 ABC transporter permease [Fervidibacillus halotolerans]